MSDQETREAVRKLRQAGPTQIRIAIKGLLDMMTPDEQALILSGTVWQFNGPESVTSEEGKRALRSMLSTLICATPDEEAAKTIRDAHKGGGPVRRLAYSEAVLNEIRNENNAMRSRAGGHNAQAGGDPSVRFRDEMAQQAWYDANVRRRVVRDDSRNAPRYEPGVRGTPPPSFYT